MNSSSLFSKTEVEFRESLKRRMEAAEAEKAQSSQRPANAGEENGSFLKAR